METILKDDEPCHITSLRLHRFMQLHADLVGLSVKHQHHATEQFMNDLLDEASKSEPMKNRFRSFKGLRGATLRSSGLQISSHPCCGLMHEALFMSEEGKKASCSECQLNETADPVPHLYYEYISIWSILRIWISHPETGHRMYDYFHEVLGMVSESESKCDFMDFFSGSLFKRVLEQLGGSAAVAFDIFLFLSTDGISA